MLSMSPELSPIAFTALASPGESLACLEAFRPILGAAKASPPHPGYNWYPYDTLSVWRAVVPLLSPAFSHLQHTLKYRPVVDIGCGDGDLAFFLAHLGCSVTAVDHPWFNFNFMHGVRTLNARLGARLAIEEVNVDSNFTLPDSDYGLALFLGILYHLRNPFSALDKLAQSARYCLLSTRIASESPSGVPLRDEALAYLLDSAEANNDASNYWIFSQTGLLRLLNRTYWEILASTHLGSTLRSNPVRNDADERIYLLLRSRLRSAAATLTLSQGWFPPEPEGWCWVAKKFTIDLSLSERAGAPEFELRFVVPPFVAAASAVTLSCSANGIPLGPQVFLTPGDHAYRAPLPAAIDRTHPISLRFEVNHGLRDPLDSRDLGVIVSCRNEVSGAGFINFWIA